MSIFAGTPDYSHIIWAPQRFPEGEGGIGGLMSGVGVGLGAGLNFKEASAGYKAAEEFIGDHGFDMSDKDKRDKPSVLKSFFGQDRWTKQGSEAESDQSSEDPSQQPQGTQLGMSGGGFAPVNTGQAVSYLSGVTQQMNAMIDSQQGLLTKLNGGYNA